jgi:uncharacterized Zn-finger protein
VQALHRPLSHARENSARIERMAETSNPPIWLVVLLAGISAVAICRIFLPDWHPWYSSHNAARLDQLRKDIPGLKDKSIAQYLEENPSEKTQPFFHELPVEYPALERFAARFAVVSSLCLVLMVPFVTYGTLQFDKARAKRTPSESIEIPDAAFVASPVIGIPVADNLTCVNCAYCGRALAANDFVPGQGMSCPYCGADFRAPHV